MTDGPASLRDLDALGARDRERTRGTGLGLAFCREAVRAHGGVIWVAGGAGGGSRFRFLLPLDGDADTAALP